VHSGPLLGGVNQGDGFGWDDLPIWGGATFRAAGGVNEEENEESPGQWRRRGKCLPLRQCICVRANIPNASSVTPKAWTIVSLLRPLTSDWIYCAPTPSVLYTLSCSR